MQKKWAYSQEIRWGRERMGDVGTLWQWDKLIHLCQQNTKKYLNFVIKSCSTNVTYKNIASLEMYSCIIYDYTGRCGTCRPLLFA